MKIAWVIKKANPKLLRFELWPTVLHYERCEWWINLSDFETINFLAGYIFSVQDTGC